MNLEKTASRWDIGMRTRHGAKNLFFIPHIPSSAQQFGKLTQVAHVYDAYLCDDVNRMPETDRIILLVLELVRMIIFSAGAYKLCRSLGSRADWFGAETFPDWNPHVH